jgi:hypothetical protein
MLRSTNSKLREDAIAVKSSSAIRSAIRINQCPCSLLGIKSVLLKKYTDQSQFNLSSFGDAECSTATLLPPTVSHGKA